MAMVYRLLLLFCLICSTALAAPQRLVAYFPFWASYSHGAALSDAPVEALTHLVYAFGKLQADGTLQPGDFFADQVRIRIGADKQLYRGNYGLIPLVKQRNPRLKVLLSVGGWNWSLHFSDVAADPVKRQRFIGSALDLARRHGFDGFELDWRFPVVGGHPQAGKRADDFSNFQRLLREMRAACQARRQACELALTASPGPEAVPAGDWVALTRDADFISLIGTDFRGSWSGETGHKSPLFAPTGQPSIAAGIARLRQLGVPAEKLVLMLPAQASSWQGAPAINHGLGQPHKGSPWGTWDNEKTGPSGIFTYREVLGMRADPAFIEHWDDVAQAHTLYRARDGLLLSYESERSLAGKLAWADDQNLGGIALWEVSSDLPGLDGLTGQVFRHQHPWRAAGWDIRARLSNGQAWLTLALYTLLGLMLLLAWRAYRERRRMRREEAACAEVLVGTLITLPDELRMAAHMAQRLRARAVLPPPAQRQLARLADESMGLCRQLLPLAHSVAGRRTASDDLLQLQKLSTELAGERSLERMLEALLRYLSDDDRVAAAELMEPEETDAIAGDDVLTLSATRQEALVRHATLADYHVALRFHTPLTDTEEIYFRSLASQVVLIRSQLQTLARQPQLLSELYEVASRRERLLFIRADRGYSGIHATDLASPVHITLRLRALRLYFDETLLLQVHRSYLVRPDAVDGAQRARGGGMELLVGPHHIPIARPYLAGLKQRFPHWFTLQSACNS
ncbi:glycosyl hydrolase family 18 protein [Chitinolyticbacter albus]|uniref:glycosyl hydrolase family 18 protein n=1 Tax=Chitinolyticbacter albus TaxID=2961951 RepID=UPI00210DB748|nr:glycosyl hydrolase family 18 protein [Chitinolyticbacter albus]